MKPPNEKGALLHAPIPKSATPHYRHCNVVQVCSRLRNAKPQDCFESFGAPEIKNIFAHSSRTSRRCALAWGDVRNEENLIAVAAIRA